MKTETPRRLTPGSAVVKSADAKHAVRLVKSPLTLEGGDVLDRKCIIITASNSDFEQVWVYTGQAKIDFFWGPKGSDFIVVRCEREEDKSHCFSALDLKRGKLLRESN